MKTRFLAVLLFATLCAAGPLASAQQQVGSALGAEFSQLVGRINEKVMMRKTNEVDFAEDIKQFDVLLEKYKDENEMDRARILLMKAQLYLEILPNYDKALAVYRQFKEKFPGLNPNGNNIDDLIAELQRAAGAQAAQRALVVGAPFPPFNETDLNGKPLSLEKYKGKVVLVDFWATWCIPCLMELPAVVRAYEKYHQRGFDVIGVNLDLAADRPRLERFLEDKKLPWQQYFDGNYWTNKLALKYGISKIPAAYLLDRKGIIVAINPRGEDLERAVALETRSGYQKMLAVIDQRIRNSPYLSLAVMFAAGVAAGAVIRRNQVRKNAAPETRAV